MKMKMEKNNRLDVLSGTHIHGFDIVRSFAVIFVVIYHYFPQALSGGFIGVDIFFLLSGFLTMRYMLRMDESCGYYAVNFYKRRFFRLFPTLLTTVLICTALANFVSRDFNVGLIKQFAGSLIFFDNWTEIIAGSSYENNLFPHLFSNMWSLGVEEQFYLFWGSVVGILAFFTRKFKKGKINLNFLLAVSGLLFVLINLRMINLMHNGANITRIYYGCDSHCSGLFLGAFICLVYLKISKEGIKLPQRKNWKFLNFLAFLVFGALLIYFSKKITWENEETFTLWIPILTALSGVWLILSLYLQSVLTFRWVNKAFGWLAQRAYTIYLFHWPIFALVSQRETDEWKIAGVSITITLVLSEFTHRLVEKPFMSPKNMQDFLGGSIKKKRVYATALLTFWLFTGVGSIYNLLNTPVVTETEKSLVVGDLETSIATMQEMNEEVMP